MLNDERYAGAIDLVAGPAFGVGSSREHAVWAIQQYGFDAVIAPSFSDIFRNNCTKNGLVPVVLAARRRASGSGTPSRPTRQRRSSSTSSGSSSRRRRSGSSSRSRSTTATQQRYLEGLDDIGITLSHDDDIDAFEATRPAWLTT